jgi:cell wall-associated NlpC family hydrolase
MFPRSLPQVGAIAVLSSLSAIGCTTATLGVSPETVLATVIANLPPPTVPDGGRRAPTRTRIPESPSATAAEAGLLRTADSYVGVRYVWGGTTPRHGFDCSGFTKYVFAKHGIALPRTARQQVRYGTVVARDFHALVPGDLMFFAEPGQAISHVAIYAGNGLIIHASTTTRGVGYTDLNDGGDWFVEYFVAARRVL